MVQLATYPLFRAFDDDGNPLAGGMLYSYLSGTSTPTALYHDALFEDEWTWPAILDDAGEALIYADGVIRLRLEDQFGVQQWEVDPYGDTMAPPGTAWGALAGGFVLGAGGVPQLIDATHVRLGDYQAFMPNGAYVDQPQVTVPLSGPDGPYWLALHADPSTTVAAWTRVPGTHLLYCTSTPAALPTTDAMLVVGMVTLTAGACAAIRDQAPHRVTGPTTIPTTLSSSGTWLVLTPGTITVAADATWTCNGPLQAAHRPGILLGPGVVKFGPAQPSNPVWFCAGGTGVVDDPWTSADGSGGFIAGCNALQLRGSLVAAPGYYLYSSSTPAQIDVPVTSGDGELNIDLRGVVIRVATTGTVFLFNKNRNPTLTSTNLNTLWVRGGFFTTQTAGQLQGDAVIQGTALDVAQCRNVVIEQMKFLGLAVAVSGNVSDTLTVRSNFFRRCRVCVHFPAPGVPGGPQDVYIENNTAAISNGGGSTALNGAAFVLCESFMAHLSISRNGYACSTDDARFVKILTGSETGDSEFITIADNATEQLSTGSKLVEVVRYGTAELKNLVITGNQFGSPLSAGPPWAEGQPLLDLSYIKGVLDISNNDFPNSTVTAVKLDQFRNEDSGTLGGVGQIVQNRCGQLGTLGGKLFALTNILGAQTVLTIGRNGHENFYTGDFPPITYPTNVRFDTDVSPAGALVASPTLTLSPWDNFVRITGITIIQQIPPTWIGHTVTLLFVSIDGGMNDANNLWLNTAFRARTPNESMITLRCDGTNWQEISRVTQQLLTAVTVPDGDNQTLTLPGWATLCSVQGTAAAKVRTLTVDRNGQRLTLVGALGSAVTLYDSPPSSGNLRLAGDFVFADNKTITLIPDNASWYEECRSPN